MPSLTVDFIDVGQGDCSVIHLPDRSFILIDVGPKNSPIVNWLTDPNQMGRTCHAIILTHNDADHCGALASVLALPRSDFGKLYMLMDRPKQNEAFQRLFRKALELEKQKKLVMERLETAHAPIWSDSSICAELKVLFPSYAQNIAASSANATSGILTLAVSGQPQIVWAGDAPLLNVGVALGTTKPKWMVGPHHGAPGDWNQSAAQSALDEFMPERSFLSVGTFNQHQHPNPALVRTMAGRGCRVVCSQITRQCHPDATKNGFAVVNGNPIHGYLPAITGNPCRGATRLTHNAGGFVVDKWDAVHLEKVMKLRRPLCLN